MCVAVWGGGYRESCGRARQIHIVWRHRAGGRQRVPMREYACVRVQYYFFRLTPSSLSKQKRLFTTRLSIIN